MKIGRLEIIKNPNMKERMAGIIGCTFFLGMAAGYIMRILGW